MSNIRIATLLGQFRYVLTLGLAVRNDIVQVGGNYVIVRSARTQRLRTIPFADLRAWRRATRHGSIVRAMASALGM